MKRPETNELWFIGGLFIDSGERYRCDFGAKEVATFLCSLLFSFHALFARKRWQSLGPQVHGLLNTRVSDLNVSLHARMKSIYITELTYKKEDLQ